MEAHLASKNFNEATNSWKDKPDFNWARTQTFTSPQDGSFSTYSSSYQTKFERVLSNYDSRQEIRLSSLGTQLKQQQDDVINKINILWRAVSKKFNNTPAHDTTGNFMARVNTMSIDYLEKEAPRSKGIKSPSKLLSSKYQSQSSLGEQNRSSSSPKRVKKKAEEGLDGSETVFEKDESRDINQNEPNDRTCGETKEVEEVEMESEESEEEIKEETKEEEEDDQDYFDTFPSIEELGYHELLLKNPRPPWLVLRFKHIDFEEMKTDCIPPFVIEGNDIDHEKTYYSDSLNLGPAYRRDESITKAIQCLIKMKSRKDEGGVT
ncbi:hypothetical protein Tco_0963366 [Tanacetum coccineum]